MRESTKGERSRNADIGMCRGVTRKDESKKHAVLRYPYEVLETLRDINKANIKREHITNSTGYTRNKHQHQNIYTLLQRIHNSNTGIIEKDHPKEKKTKETNARNRHRHVARF